MDLKELKRALKKMMDIHSKRVKEGAAGEATAAAVRERARRHRDGILVAARASEAACASLVAARNDSTIGSKLGETIGGKGMKAGDIALQWDASGDGEIDKKEFRKNVLALGVTAPPSGIDAIFDGLDVDGGGSLDMRELQKALKQFIGEADARRNNIRAICLELITVFKALRHVQAEYEAELKAEGLATEAEASKATAAPSPSPSAPSPSLAGRKPNWSLLRKPAVAKADAIKEVRI